MTAIKTSAAGIRTQEVTRQTLELTRTVPARLAYDHRQHVAVRTPADGVLDTLMVKPGDVVSAGQTLSILRSPAIGKARSEVLDGQARFPIQVRLPESWRENSERLRQLPVAKAGGKPVPLSELADITLEQTPPTVEHDNGRRRTFVSANVRGCDIASFVSEAQRAVAENIDLPPNYEMTWGGDFESLQSASRRLLLITPIVLLVIFLLPHTSFGSIRLAALIFLCVPMAASGRVFALQARGMPFSIAAGVGFIALFGVAVLNGLVWVSDAENHRKSGDDPKASALAAASDRLRPVLMTAMVASLGFLPMALSTSDGAERRSILFRDQSRRMLGCPQTCIRGDELLAMLTSLCLSKADTGSFPASQASLRRDSPTIRWRRRSTL